MVIAYLLYQGFFGGNRYGPRMYLIGYPFLVLTVVSVLTPLLENKTAPKRVAFATNILLIGHFVTCVVGAIFLGHFFRGVVNARMDMYDRVRAQSLHNAVVIVHSGGGAYLPFTPNRVLTKGLD